MRKNNNKLDFKKGDRVIWKQVIKGQFDKNGIVFERVSAKKRPTYQSDYLADQKSRGETSYLVSSGGRYHWINQSMLKAAAKTAAKPVLKKPAIKKPVIKAAVKPVSKPVSKPASKLVAKKATVVAKKATVIVKKAAVVIKKDELKPVKTSKKPVQQAEVKKAIAFEKGDRVVWKKTDKGGHEGKGFIFERISAKKRPVCPADYLKSQSSKREVSYLVSSGGRYHWVVASVIKVEQATAKAKPVIKPVVKVVAKAAVKVVVKAAVKAAAVPVKKPVVLSEVKPEAKLLIDNKVEAKSTHVLQAKDVATVKNKSEDRKFIEPNQKNVKNNNLFVINTQKKIPKEKQGSSSSLSKTDMDSLVKISGRRVKYIPSAFDNIPGLRSDTMIHPRRNGIFYKNNLNAKNKKDDEHFVIKPENVSSL
jgi:hypothetical protein